MSERPRVLARRLLLAAATGCPVKDRVVRKDNEDSSRRVTCRDAQVGREKGDARGGATAGAETETKTGFPRDVLAFDARMVNVWPRRHLDGMHLAKDSA